MKIFRHRGDIYISKSGYKSSREERILLSLLAVIVVFTIVFLVIMGHKYSSITDFIAGNDVVTTDPVIVDDIDLPDISGKTNFLVVETDDEQSSIHYAYLLQMDCDNLSYKVCTLDPDMIVDGRSLYDIYLSGGGALLQSELTSSLGFDINYYLAFENSNFVEFINKLGTFIYPNMDKIKFNGGTDDDAYSIRISDGEQNIGGNDAVNLVRYFSNDQQSFSTANEIVLYGLTQLFNAENFDRSEMLFRLLITNASTNITVRDFENGKDCVMVFCQRNTDITVYSCVPQYSAHQLTSDSLQEIKGYFQ